MGWKRVVPNPCEPPLFWSFKQVGSIWECPEYGKEWQVRNNPDRLWGGKVFVPNRAGVLGQCRKRI